MARAARGDYDLELTPWPHTPKPFHPGDRIRCAYNDVAEHPAFPQFIHFGKIGTVISAPPGESDRPGRVWVQFDQESSKSPHHSKLLGHLRPLLTYDYVPEQPKPERQLDPEPEQPKAEQQPEPEPEVKPKRQRKPKPPAVPRLSHDDFVLLKQRFLYWLRRNAHHHTVVRWLRDDNEAAATNRFDLPPMRQVKFNEAMSEYQSQLSELEIQCVESAWNEAWLKAMNEEGDFLHELTEAPISAGDYVQVVAVSSHNQKFIGRVGSVIEISGNRYKVKVPGSPALTFSAKHLQRFTFKAQYLDAISDLIQTLSPQDIEEEAQWREAAGDLEAAQAYRTVRTPEEYNQLTLLTLA